MLDQLVDLAAGQGTAADDGDLGAGRDAHRRDEAQQEDGEVAVVVEEVGQRRSTWCLLSSRSVAPVRSIPSLARRGPGRRRPVGYRHPVPTGPDAAAAPAAHLRDPGRRRTGRLRLRRVRATTCSWCTPPASAPGCSCPWPGPSATGSTAGPSTSGATDAPAGRPTGTSPGRASAPTSSPPSTALGLDRPAGFGHSCGGASLLLAEQARPRHVPLALPLRAGRRARPAASRSPSRRTRCPGGPGAAGRPSPTPRTPSSTSPRSRRSPSSTPTSCCATSRTGSSRSRPTRAGTARRSGCGATATTRPRCTSTDSATAPSPGSPRSACPVTFAYGTRDRRLRRGGHGGRRRPGAPRHRRGLRRASGTSVPSSVPTRSPPGVARGAGRPRTAHPRRSLSTCRSNRPGRCRPPRCRRSATARWPSGSPPSSGCPTRRRCGRSRGRWCTPPSSSSSGTTRRGRGPRRRRRAELARGVGRPAGRPRLPVARPRSPTRPTRSGPTPSCWWPTTSASRTPTRSPRSASS